MMFALVREKQLSQKLLKLVLLLASRLSGSLVRAWQLSQKLLKLVPLLVLRLSGSLVRE